MHGYLVRRLGQMTAPEPGGDGPAGAAAVVREPDALRARGGAEPGRLWAWLLGLLALLVLAVVAPGAEAGAGATRRRAGARPAARGVAARGFGTRGGPWRCWWARSCWPGPLSQFPHFADPSRLNDLLVFTQSKTLGELALAEQGVLAALTPLRDLCGLGD